MPMDIADKWQLAYRYFRKRYARYGEFASDFAAHCAEHWLLGRHHDKYLKWMASDYVRTQLRGTKDAMNKISQSIDEEPWKVPTKVPPEIARFEDCWLLRDPRLTERQRAMLILHYEYGFNLKEIADLFGLGMPRVSQIITEAQTQQRDRMK